jgi:hypothetical protein
MRQGISECKEQNTYEMLSVNGSVFHHGATFLESPRLEHVSLSSPINPLISRHYKLCINGVDREFRPESDLGFAEGRYH